MEKRKLYVDFDGCIANSIKAICEMYDEDYWTFKNYKKIDWSEINSWNFDELELASKEDIDNYFNQERFFNRVSFMPWADFILRRLSSYFDITIVSMGNTKNLVLKETWCKIKLPFANYMGINFDDHSDKSHIDMTDGIFIDDVSNNLKTSNAQKKICFGDEYSWNSDWTDTRCANWFDIWKEIGEPVRREVAQLVSAEEQQILRRFLYG